jgi:glycerol-3-phosphate dehydrogenase subunit C
MERIFDICHGCRRCVSLCGAFPTLFDLVDESKTGEVDGVDKKDYWKVVDQCYLCDLCYMTKCPYVPPHEWNLDFPHTMLRAKAIKFKKGGVGAASGSCHPPTCTASSPASRSWCRWPMRSTRPKPLARA